MNHDIENKLDNDFIAQAQNNSFAFISTIEPKCFEDAISNDNWIMAMHLEIDLITRNRIWELVPPSNTHNVLELEWSFKSILHENGTICENHAKLVVNDFDHIKKIH